jgi:hypothetical protein
MPENNLITVEIMLQKKVHETMQQTELMKQLNTPVGFCQAYFNVLSVARTNEEAFNAVNDQYLEYFGEEKYSSFDSFRVTKNRILKKQNQ